AAGARGRAGRPAALPPHGGGGGGGGPGRIPGGAGGGGRAPPAPAETDPRRLAALMVGDAIEESEPARPGPDVGAAPAGPPALACEALWVTGDHGRAAVRGVTLGVGAGGIVGVAGVAGNAQRELAEAVAGMRAVARGCVTLDGRDVTGDPVRARIERGLRYLPGDRRRVGMAADLSVAQNLALKSFRQPRFGSPLWQDRGAIRREA